jgi:hypothetical protein
LGQTYQYSQGTETNVLPYTEENPLNHMRPEENELGKQELKTYQLKTFMMHI